MRTVGTTVRGIRCPIIREGDNLEDIIVESVLNAAKDNNFELNDKDVIAVTESVVARAQGNYATIKQIAVDVKNKFGADSIIGVIFPILSRNRFAICLKGIAHAAKKIVLMLQYPTDEVGNALIDLKTFQNTTIKPYWDALALEDYRKLFGNYIHQFTGIDYVDYYKNIIEEQGAECEIIFSNHAKYILSFTNKVIVCNIHSRFSTKKYLEEDMFENTILTLDDIMNHPVNGSGYNENYGLLGSNKASEDKVKLFPRDCQSFVNNVQQKIIMKTGKNIEVMIYGDGAFKDPQGKIWELADPVVSPGYTKGLEGTPNEVKIKYLADNDFREYNGEELQEKIIKSIEEKDNNLKGKMISEGTTPRKITDLLGSLCDLTSGSGDKGTPIVLIQGYFDNYSVN